MALELGTDQLDVLGRIEETIRGTVQGEEPFPRADIFQKSLLLIRFDFGMIGINHQRIILFQRFAIKNFEVLGVFKHDRLVGPCRRQLAKAHRRLMVALVP